MEGLAEIVAILKCANGSNACCLECRFELDWITK